MPEILDAVELEGNHFCIVQLERGAEQGRFRFGVSRDGYLAIKRALQLRPFDQMPGIPHRYFFANASYRVGGERIMMSIRVEQGREGKNVETEAPRDLVANLKWFSELDDWSKAQHLAVTA